MLSATLVAPGHDKVIPLEPEFIVPQAGADKQDCENMAAKRWLATHGRRYADLGAVFLGDDLFSRQPFCQAVLDAGGDFVFVCKPSSHPLIAEYLTGISPPSIEQAIKRGKQRFVHRYRWLRDVPLRDGRDALVVNWFEIEIVNPAGETTSHNSFVTSLPVGLDSVVELAACGRARWKIENETFNAGPTAASSAGEASHRACSRRIAEIPVPPAMAEPRRSRGDNGRGDLDESPEPEAAIPPGRGTD